MGKTAPEVLNTARGRRPRAMLKTKGTVFPIRTDLGNVFIFFSPENYFIRNIFVDFLLQQFHTVRVCCLLKYLKEEIQFSLILNC